MPPGGPGLMPPAGGPPPGSAAPSASAPPSIIEPAHGAPPPAEPPKVGAQPGPGSSAPSDKPSTPPGGRGPSGGSSGLLALLNSIDSEDEMEMTNPYNVPSPEEIAAESARLPPPEGGSGKRRKA